MITILLVKEKGKKPIPFCRNQRYRTDLRGFWGGEMRGKYTAMSKNDRCALSVYLAYGDIAIIWICYVALDKDTAVYV